MSKFKDMKLRYKIGVGVVTGAAVLGMAGGAFAYFTSNGSGSSTNNTIGAPTAVTLTVTQVTGLVPGAAPTPVPFSFTNTTGNGAQTFGTVSAAVSNIQTSTAEANKGLTCTAALADFQYAAGTAIGEVADGGSYTADATHHATAMPTIQVADNGNQDACQGATFTVTLTAGQGS